MRRLLLALAFVALFTLNAAADCEQAPRYRPLLGLRPLEVNINTSCMRVGANWLIEAEITDDRSGGATRDELLLLDRGSKLLARGRVLHGELYNVSFESTLDVDGDGALEVLGTAHHQNGDLVTTKLVMFAVRNRELVQVLEVPFAVKRGQASCHSTFAIIPDGAQQRIELTKGVTVRPKIAAADKPFEASDCAQAPRTFKWSPITAMTEVGVEMSRELHDPSCPSLTKIASWINLAAGRTISMTRCGVGRFPRPATVIVAERAQDESGDTEWEMNRTTILLVEGDRVIARHRPDEYVDATGVYESHELVATGDLDGDGVDELMIEKSLGGPMGYESTLVVFRIRGASLVKVSEQPYAAMREPTFAPMSEHDQPEFKPEHTLTCEGTVALQPKTKQRGAELVVTRTIRAGSKVPKTALAGFCGNP